MFSRLLKSKAIFLGIFVFGVIGISHNSSAGTPQRPSTALKRIREELAALEAGESFRLEASSPPATPPVAASQVYDPRQDPFSSAFESQNNQQANDFDSSRGLIPPPPMTPRTNPNLHFPQSPLNTSWTSPPATPLQSTRRFPTPAPTPFAPPAPTTRPPTPPPPTPQVPLGRDAWMKQWQNRKASQVTPAPQPAYKPTATPPTHFGFQPSPQPASPFDILRSGNPQTSYAQRLDDDAYRRRRLEQIRQEEAFISAYLQREAEMRRRAHEAAQQQRFSSQQQQNFRPRQKTKVEEAREILGVAPGASEQAIRKAFKVKALELHPDKGGSHDAFTKLKEAQELLLQQPNGR